MFVLLDYKLYKTLYVGNNGGEALMFSDVDNDGENEILIRQSAGTYSCRLHRDEGNREFGQEWIDDENFDLFQLTCMKMDGRILWQIGKPWQKQRPYNSHGSGTMTQCADINGDGKKEIVYVYKDNLCIVDACTGETLNSIKTGTDILDNVLLQKAGKSLYNIILKNGGKGPDGYGKLMQVYDNCLNFLWGTQEGNGHSTVMKDIDYDGIDEIFEGYALFDHDGTILWSFEHPSHVDHINIEDINDDGREEIIYCTDNEDLLIVDMQGKIIFKSDIFIHPQKTSVGKFIENIEGKQIFMNNHAAFGDSYMLDCKGNVICEFPCNGYGYNFIHNGKHLIAFIPHPGRLPSEKINEYEAKAKLLGYGKLPLRKDDYYSPFILNGRCEIVYSFPVLENEIDVSVWGKPEWSKVDHGAGYNLLMEDIDKDGRTEFIFYNREKILFFKDVSL